MSVTDREPTRLIVAAPVDLKRKFKSATSLLGLSMNEASILFAQKFIKNPKATLEFIKN